MILFEKYNFEGGIRLTVYPSTKGGCGVKAADEFEKSVINIELTRNETKELLDLLMSNYESNADQL